MEEASNFVLQLYRAAREYPADEFQQMALRRVNDVFPYASAFWGEARTLNKTAVIPTGLFTENLDPDFLVAWSESHHDDPVVPLLLAKGGVLKVHVPSFYRGAPQMADVGRRFKLMNMTVAAVPGLDAREVQWLSLFRRRPDDSCTREQQRWLEYLMPHFGEALRINRALNPDRTIAKAYSVAAAEAVTGKILRADDGFLAMLAEEWTGFDGQHVPTTLTQGWEKPSSVHFGRRCRIDVRRSGELVYLAARLKSSLEGLTQRKLVVADMYARGLSYKEIARSLDVSPSTVRNHLAKVFEALGVHGKAEMIARLGEIGRSGPGSSPVSTSHRPSDDGVSTPPKGGA